MSDKETTESNKRNFAPITTLICILSGTFLIMLVMLFSLYNKALNGIIEGKIPIDKLDLKMTDTFIGIIATLIGIMVTFVIGYQILNAIQIKKDIEKHESIIDELKNESCAINEKLEFKLSLLELKDSFDTFVQSTNTNFSSTEPTKYKLALLYIEYLIYVFENSKKYKSKEVSEYRRNLFFKETFRINNALYTIYKYLNTPKIKNTDFDTHIQCVIYRLNQFHQKGDDKVIIEQIMLIWDSLQFKKKFEVSDVIKIKDRFDI